MMTETVRPQDLRTMIESLIALGRSADGALERDIRAALADRDNLVANEREACARMAEKWLADFGGVKPEFVDARHWATDAIKDIADAIRTRGIDRKETA